MSAHLRYLATVERAERRREAERELDEIVRAVEDGRLAPAAAMVRIAAVTERRRQWTS